ncbi:hypothetical protein [Mucilaginibacter aquariorum]|uniref:Amidohydrolase n=1 Tax=Mucilaginibacter aquariorum TaxID=2967225 RepID=A0ABT1T441_9SPHI|nr:hypothetical protein [Mucilaginibacter aquariorum]MCQ6959322.1 hypothetical protein [Mucilaginibacter aquariorum]
MNSFFRFASLGILSLSFPGLLNGSMHTHTGPVKTKQAEAVYYTAEDFSSVKKFDVHIHINTNETTFINQAQKDNFKFLDIVDDRPFGLTMAKQQKIGISDLGKFPDQMAFATTFSVKDWNSSDW